MPRMLGLSPLQHHDIEKAIKDAWKCAVEVMRFSQDGPQLGVPHLAESLLIHNLLKSLSPTIGRDNLKPSTYTKFPCAIISLVKLNKSRAEKLSTPGTCTFLAVFIAVFVYPVLYGTLRVR